MPEITLILSLITLAFVVYIYISLDKIILAKSQIIKQDLQTDLNKNKEEVVDRVLEKLMYNSSLHSSHLNDTKSKIDLKFQELQSNLQFANQSTSQNQKNEFSEIKNLNSTHLMELQKNINQSLSLAIANLSSLNTQNFESLRKTNQEKLDQINIQVQSRLDQNFAQHQKSFQEVTNSVGQMQQTAKQMIDSTSSIDKLNNIFARSSSKSFGDFGEKYLESLLSQNLHPSVWQKQVKMTYSADKIDFVLHFGDQKIGIDSKFPATKYQDYQFAPADKKLACLKEFLVSVKLMATDIAIKYGKNHEFDSLLMYLPSDGMYVTVVENTSLVHELQKLRVMPVSPITIFPMVIGAKTYYSNKFVNENAKEIMQGLDNIKRNVAVFQDEFRKLGDKIKQAQQNYDKAGENLIGVEKTVMQLEQKQDQKPVLDSNLQQSVIG